MRVLKFGIVGLVNTGIDFALFSGLTLGLGLNAIPANVVSYSVGVVTSFVLNRSWTFRGRNGRSARSQMLLFVVGSVGGLAVSTAVVALLVGVLAPLPSKAISVFATFLWNYGFSTRVVFRR